MTSRRKSILETSVDDFINNANLITSGYLYKKHDFGIKTAMIRRELNKLDKEGFLHQAHPSGGRIPTNKAYRFYVKRLQEDKSGNLDITERKREKIYKDLLSKRLDEFTKLMAEYIEAMSIVYNPHKEEFYSSGLRNIFESINTEKKEDFLSIVCDFEMLPNRLSKELDNITKRDLNIYIGGSPITESDLLSVISKKLDSEGDELMLLTVGPKRMNYRKSLCIFEFFDEELN